MKAISLSMFLLLLGVQAYGQKKGSAEAMRLDSLTRANQLLALQVDSLTKLSGAQALQLDSVSRHLKAHETMYAAIKDKVIKKDFDPARSAAIIDSLKTSRDQTLASLTTESQVLTDSMAVLKGTNANLKASIATWEARSSENETVVRDLEQLKGLLDQKIITQAEFDQRKAKLLAKWK